MLKCCPKLFGGGFMIETCNDASINCDVYIAVSSGDSAGAAAKEFDRNVEHLKDTLYSFESQQTPFMVFVCFL